MRYTAPKTGNYKVSWELYRYRPTGRFKLVENSSKKFWQFWKPRYVMQEIYERCDVEEGLVVQTLVENEKLCLNRKDEHV